MKTEAYLYTENGRIYLDAEVLFKEFMRDFIKEVQDANVKCAQAIVNNES